VHRLRSPRSSSSARVVGLLALVLVLTLIAAACGGDDDDSASDPGKNQSGNERVSATPATAQQMEAQPWQLQSFQASGGDTLTAASTSQPATAEFASGNVSGSTGCNNYNGSYQLSANGKISFGVIAATKAACSANLGPQEQGLLDGYQHAVKAVIATGALQFLGPTGQPLLIFQAVKGTQLEGITWNLLDYRTPTSVTSAVAGAEATLSFAGGKITGTTGCNDFTATYTGGEGTNGPIKIADVQVGNKTCSTPPGVMAQQSTYLTALSTVVKFETGSNRLTLLDSQGRDAATYEGT
jgi:heat shock protein HslJ